jgi:hypothetical protein
MAQPLVLRPPYGTSGIAESKLPDGGGPAQKGVSLDPSIPGSSTYAKPSDEAPRETGKDDESIHRQDNADDLTKGPQTTPDERDHGQTFSPSYAPPVGGKSDQDVTEKTKWPYRDGFPNRNASAEFVAELWRLKTATEVRLSLPGKVAARLSEIEQGLNPKVIDRSSHCGVTLKRADIPNMRWIFAVNCGNGPKVVKLRADRGGNAVKLGKMDLFLSCSCPAWRWWGSEHNSQSGGYLDGKPRGTASAPDIRDPNRVNRVCKHAEAVLQSVREWDIPARKKK